MKNRVDDSIDNKLVNVVIDLTKQSIEGKTNQAPSSLSVDGNISVDQVASDMIFKDPNTGIRQILIGAHPVDGHMNIWITKPNSDVITELGG